MKKKKMDIVTKMTIIGVGGLVCVTVIILLMTFMNKPAKNRKPVDGAEHNAQDTQTNDNGDIQYARALAVIKNVDSSNNMLTILNIETNDVVSLAIDSAVDMKDEYDSLLTLVQFNIGDMVETKYDTASNRPEYVHITAKTWERKSISGLHVDAEKHTITIGNDQYGYADEAVSVFNGDFMNIGDIKPEDKVTLRGYQDKVWTLIMESGHGFITLKNHSYFVGGVLEIGISKMVDIEDVTSVVVPVGVHNIVVTKDELNYETEVMVANGQKVLIDVSDASPRMGIVEVNVFQEGIEFTINDKVYNDFSEPISLEYGTYNIKVVKDQYVDWEKELVVNQPFTKFDINLEKKPIFLHVDSPEGVDIYINGNFSGKIPISIPIDPGNYTVTLRKDGYYSKMHPARVEDDGKDAYWTFEPLKKMESIDHTDPGNENNGGNDDQDSSNDSQEHSPNHSDTGNEGDVPRDSLEDTSNSDTPSSDNYNTD